MENTTIVASSLQSSQITYLTQQLQDNLGPAVRLDTCEVTVYGVGGWWVRDTQLNYLNVALCDMYRNKKKDTRRRGRSHLEAPSPLSRFAMVTTGIKTDC